MNHWFYTTTTTTTGMKLPASLHRLPYYYQRLTLTKLFLIIIGVIDFTLQVHGQNSVQTIVDQYAFQYKYDGRKRMTHKKVPGADWVYMVYDDRDRLVLTQDGEQRKSNKWSFTKYDALNRPVITGIHTHSSAATQAQMQTNVNDYYDALILPASTGARYESFSTQPDHVHGYDNKSFPIICAPEDCLTITYYDNYQYRTSWGNAYHYTPGSVSSVTANTILYTPPGNESTSVIGQVTGTKVRTVDAEHSGNTMYLKSAIYYDEKYRAIQIIADNGMGGTDRTSTLYDFVGKTLAVKTTHVRNNFTWNNPGWFTVTSSSVAYLGGGAAGNINTVQQLAAGTDGYVEFTAGTSQNTTSVWLGSGSDYFNLAQGTYSVIENGVTQASGYFTAGDIFRIKRVAGVYYYYVRDNLVYTATATSTAAYPLTVNLNRYQDDPSALVNFSASFAQTSQHIERTFTYDHAGRLLTTHHSIDGATPILLAKNEYNELGQLVDKKLHSTQANGSDARQSIDYRYNIRGWLTSINSADLSSANTNINDDSDITKSDLFGMELAYEKPVATLTDENDLQFNGNISAITYSNNLSLGTVKSNGYKFDYDPMNRLQSSHFRQRKNNNWSMTEYLNGTTPANKEAYSETGFAYDLNGNILQLNRSGAATVSSTVMDQLGYTYEGNQLLRVDDGGDKTKGFIDGNVTGDDYTYDANGNMTVDKNKGITAITYNHLNLPDKVTKTTGEYLKYTYDATGRKLSQSVFSATGELKKKSDYAGEYFYENDTLKFINHEEGRVVMVKEGQPIAPEYQYHLKDHLGNVRTTFTTKEETEETTATLEAQYENTERSQYLKYDDTRRVLSHLFDHTNGVNPSTTPGYSIRLNGSDNERNGIARSLSVMPGDKIDMQVFGKYYDPNTPQTNQTAWDNLVGLITQVADAAQTVVVDGVGYTSGSLRLPPATGVLTDPNENAAYPKAHLNWGTFDRDWKFLDGGAKQLQGGAEDGTDVPFAEISKSIEIKEPGYVYIWLSNTSAQQRDVFFDDFNVTHTKSPIIQTEDYYAFGLTFNSYQRENSLLNKYQYNGKELQTDFSLNWLDYGARMYQPEIGRWSAIDPLSEKYFSLSSYNFVANNPILFVDPDGREIWISYGDNQRVRYDNGKLYNEDGSKYKGKDSFVSTTLKTLNTMNSTKNGATVIGELSKSENKFNFENSYIKDKNGNDIKGALSFEGAKEGGGTIHAAGLTENSDFGEKVENTSHELFHGYQFEMGNTESSVNKETEAYLFGRSVALDAGVKVNYGFGNSRFTGEIYQNSMFNLLTNPKFDQKEFNISVMTFKTGAAVNYRGLYNSHPYILNYKPTISKFYPLIH